MEGTGNIPATIASSCRDLGKGDLSFRPCILCLQVPAAEDGPERPHVYGRPFRCKACGSREVVLYAIDDQAELDAIQRALAGPRHPAKAPTTPDPHQDPDAGLL